MNMNNFSKGIQEGIINKQQQHVMCILQVLKLFIECFAKSSDRETEPILVVFSSFFVWFFYYVVCVLCTKIA